MSKLFITLAALTLVVAGCVAVTNQPDGQSQGGNANQNGPVDAATTTDEAKVMENQTTTPSTTETTVIDVDLGVEVAGVKAFTITGKNFEFSLKQIKVKEGDRVKITFQSEQGFHDWKIDEFNAATNRVQSGESASVEFIANKKGQFEYYCSVGSHRQLGMVGTLIVE